MPNSAEAADFNDQHAGAAAATPATQRGPSEPPASQARNPHVSAIAAPDPFASASLVPMLIAGLVLIVIAMIVAVALA